MNDSKKGRPDKDPGAELEERLRKNPSDKDAKVDLGSAESMDASDPSSVVQPGHDEPVPSSCSPKKTESDRD